MLRRRKGRKKLKQKKNTESGPLFVLDLASVALYTVLSAVVLFVTAGIQTIDF